MSGEGRWDVTVIDPHLSLEKSMYQHSLCAGLTLTDDAKYAQIILAIEN